MRHLFRDIIIIYNQTIYDVTGQIDKTLPNSYEARGRFRITTKLLPSKQGFLIQSDAEAWVGMDSSQITTETRVGFNGQDYQVVQVRLGKDEGSGQFLKLMLKKIND